MTNSIFNLFKSLLSKFGLSLFLCLLLNSTTLFAAPEKGVLVTSDQSTIISIKRKQIRRLFLGLQTPTLPDTALPVINTSDPITYSEFLKNVMFLTESGYKRKLLKRIFRQGADQIETIDSEKSLVEYLIRNPNKISFMSSDAANKQKNLKVIQVLW